MIKRSIPATLSVRCEDIQYASGVHDGIIYTLQSLQHECDIIMRLMPAIEKYGEEEYRVRSRFTAREKRPGKLKGEWIKIERAFYEEEFNDSFDTDKEWTSLTEDQIKSAWSDLWNELGNGKLAASDSTERHTLFMFYRIVDAKLKELNHG